MPPYSCTVPGRKPGHVLEGDQRDVERIAEADEARAFDRGVDVERAGQVRRLVGDDADGSPAEPRKADDDVLGEVLVHLEKVPIVCDRVDQVEHVVGLIRRRRDQRVERLVLAIDGSSVSTRAADRRGCCPA